MNYSARNINFSVPTGKVVGLVGSNGAGKTTIIKSIIGVLPFTEGTITVGGFDVAKQSDKAKRLIGYVPDDHTVYDKLTGREYINYIGSLYGATKERKKYVTDELAKQFDISYALDSQIAGYSHGMKQKICILGALVHNPKLWILDEPMVGLDHQTMGSLCEFIRAYADGEHSVLFSSHNLDVGTYDYTNTVDGGSITVKLLDIFNGPIKSTSRDMNKLFTEDRYIRLLCEYKTKDTKNDDHILWHKQKVYRDISLIVGREPDHIKHLKSTLKDVTWSDGTNANDYMGGEAVALYKMLSQAIVPGKNPYAD